MTFSDEKAALSQFKIISYFRLAAYWKPMEANKITHSFKPQSTFENAVKLYYFDKELRALVFTGIQTIEVALRTKVIHHMSMKYGAFWFCDPATATFRSQFDINMSHIRKELARSKEDFIKEHYAKYDTPDIPPAWKSLEVITFGTLSKIFYNLNDGKVKKDIAKEFNVPHQKFFESWVKSLSDLRNVVAHHARLWNRNFPTMPLFPAKLSAAWVSSKSSCSQKLYPQLCILAYLEKAVHPNSNFANNLKTLLAQYPNVDPRAMGFPKDWENEPLWR